MLRLNHFELVGTRTSLLERASSIVSLRTTEIAPRFSLFKRPSMVKEQSNEEDFDDESNLITDEHEEGIIQVGKSAHRCSMIKKYNITTFFTPKKDKKASYRTL